MKKILRPKQVAQMLSISMTTLWRIHKSGQFVRKVKLSAKAVGFFEDDIAEWLEKKKVN